MNINQASPSISIHQKSVRSILTRTGGYLSNVTSHSLQPYSGCTYGHSLCGTACYVQHNPWILNKRKWGSFLEVKTNAADLYRKQVKRERKWAESKIGSFGIFMSSSTDPYVPQEMKFRITRNLLQMMIENPPDELVLQTHSHLVLNDLSLIRKLSQLCRLRVHISIETDMERLPDLPRHASPISKRIEALRTFHENNIRCIAAVAPLLPIVDPETFFKKLAESCDGVILDHFIGGDGSHNGSRTFRTHLPVIMEQIESTSISLEYLNQIKLIACQIMPGKVGIGQDGFAGRFLD